MHHAIVVFITRRQQPVLLVDVHPCVMFMVWIGAGCRGILRSNKPELQMVYVMRGWQHMSVFVTQL